MKKYSLALWWWAAKWLAHIWVSKCWIIKWLKKLKIKVYKINTLNNKWIK